MDSYTAKQGALDTVYRLTYALDKLSYPELAPLFHPDKKLTFDIYAILKIPAKDYTPSEYFNVATGGLGGFEFTEHILSSPIVNANNDGTMTVKVMVTAFHGFVINGNVEGATVRVTWTIDLAKHNDQWVMLKWVINGRIPPDRPDLFEQGQKRGHSGQLRASIVGP